MRKKTQKTPVSFFIVYAVAIVAAFVISRLLPVPFDWKNLIFFVLIVVFAFIGVALITLITRRKR